MAEYVCSPFYPVAARWETSHRAGWALYWAHALGARLLTSANQYQKEFKKGDRLYLYHGMEWGGQLNLQGGLTPDVRRRVEWFVRAMRQLGKRHVHSLDIPMPDYTRLFVERFQNDASKIFHDEVDSWNKLDWQFFETAEAQVSFEPYPTLATTLIAGDSHALSQFVPMSSIRRHDGLTLHGALKKGLPYVTWLDRQPDAKWQRLVLYLGNIDLRHHLARQGPDAVVELVVEYVKQVKQLKKDYHVLAVEVVQALPINNDARRIPKTGWFKGAPYAGTWEQRTQLVKAFNSELVKRFKGVAAVYKHPAHFTNTAGELAEEVMEKPQSVHLRPTEYRLIQEGGQWHV